MTSHVAIGWAAGARAEMREGALVLTGATRTARVARVPASLVAVIEALPGGASWAELAARASESGGAAAAWSLRAALERLARDGWLRAIHLAGERPIAELAPGSRGIALPGARSDAPVAISRFAYLRSEEGTLVVQSPASVHAIVLRDPIGAALFAAFATPSDPARAAQAAGASPDVAADFATLLVTAELAGTSDPAPSTWEFHDLLLHVHSRLGRVDSPAGATGRSEQRAESPAIVARASEASVPLPVPDLDLAIAREPPFAAAVERRASQRAFGDVPISCEQLGELLYRCARTRSVHAGSRFEVASRPYASAGGLYEHEVYVIVHRAADLARGVYAYDGVAHALAPVAAPSELMEQLLGNATCALRAETTPHVLLVITARFGRITRKYERIAYALTLKNAGALLQTFSLVAHAMGLAGCPLGSGNADAFASITKAPFFEESSVAEFALGTRAKTTASSKETTG